MNKTNYNIYNKNKQGLVTINYNKEIDLFIKKIRLLLNDIEKMVKMMNDVYDPYVHFKIIYTGYSENKKIIIDKIDDNINCIEIPEIKEIYFEDLFDIYTTGYLKNIFTVKLPKCANEIDLNKSYWVKLIHTLFVCDNTDIKYDSYSNLGQLKLLIIQPNTKINKAIVKKF